MTFCLKTFQEIEQGLDPHVSSWTAKFDYVSKDNYHSPSSKSADKCTYSSTQAQTLLQQKKVDKLT